jgi:hypothetical protein
MDAEVGTVTPTLLAHPLVNGTASRKTAIRSVVLAGKVRGSGVFLLREHAGLAQHETQPARSDVYIPRARVG